MDKAKGGESPRPLAIAASLLEVYSVDADAGKGGASLAAVELVEWENGSETPLKGEYLGITHRPEHALIDRFVCSGRTLGNAAQRV